MYHIQFPKLGFELDIQNKIQIGSFSVYWYGIIIAVGLILAVLYGMANAKRLGVSADKLLDCVIVGVITGIVGARTYYVLFQWDYYSNHTDKILAVNEGGLAIYGGIIGALIGGILTAKINKMNVPALLDVAAVGFFIGQGIGRWGNFFNQEAYGVATDLPWGMMSEGTNNIAVHPCFLYESIWCLLGALVLHLFSKSKLRKYHGQMALLYMVWYGAERSIVEGLRTDSLYIPSTDLRISQILSVFITVLGIVLLIVLHKKKYERIKPYGSEDIQLNKFKKPVYSTENGIDENATEICSHSASIELPEEEIKEELRTQTKENKREALSEDTDTVQKTPKEEQASEEELFDINSVIASETEVKKTKKTKK